jgi:hypothetical protein
MPRAELERLAVEPTLASSRSRSASLACRVTHGERQRRSLPGVVVVDLGDRAAVRFASCCLTERSASASP